MTTAGLEQLMRAVTGERVAIGSVVRVGRTIVVERIHVPLARDRVAGEVVFDATFSLGLGAPSLERALARVDLVAHGGRLEGELTLEREGVVRPGGAWAARVVFDGAVVTRGARVAVRGEARLLVDGERVYLHGVHVEAPGLSLRGELSGARHGRALRGNLRGTARVAELLAALGAPQVAHPRDGALAVTLTLGGSAEDVELALDARIASLAFSLGRARWVPPLRLEGVALAFALAPGGPRLRAEARLGDGTLTVERRASGELRVLCAAIPARELLHALPPSPELRLALGELLARGVVDVEIGVDASKVARGRAALRADGVKLEVAPLVLDLGREVDLSGTVFRLELDAGEARLPPALAVTGRARADGVARRDGVELRVTSARIGARGPRGEEALVLEDVDVVARVARTGGVTFEVGPATARTSGGQVTAAGEGYGDAGAITGELRLGIDGASAALLEALAALGPRGPVVVCAAPADRGAPRAPGVAWLPEARVDGDVRVVVRDGAVRASGALAVRSGGSDVQARLRSAEASAVDLHVEGRLALAEAIDLGLFDGGDVPAREGVLGVALHIGGPPAVLALAGALRADRIRFGRVRFEDVQALVSAKGGVAVWRVERARLAGGVVTADILVDRRGQLGGMRAHVTLDGADLALLSDGVAEGALSAELAVEQHGAEDAPVAVEGALVVRGASVPELARRLGSTLPPGLAARNARARGDVTARVSVAGGAARLLDVVLPLPDAWIGGDVRFEREGHVEAHLEVHARELVAVPVRLRGSMAGDAPTLDVDVLAAALVGVASARARARAPARRVWLSLPRMGALEAAARAIDWEVIARRARYSL